MSFLLSKYYCTGDNSKAEKNWEELLSRAIKFSIALTVVDTRLEIEILTISFFHKVLINLNTQYADGEFNKIV